MIRLSMRKMFKLNYKSLALAIGIWVVAGIGLTIIWAFREFVWAQWHEGIMYGLTVLGLVALPFAVIGVTYTGIEADKRMRAEEKLRIEHVRKKRELRGNYYINSLTEAANRGGDPPDTGKVTRG